jgi:kynurenine formamidase
MDQSLPSYDQLPVAADGPPGSSWGVWGPGDTLGCLNLLTPERAAGAAAGVRSGRVFNLNLEMELPDPPLYGRSAFEHSVIDRATGHDDELSNWNTQSSSQWDGFRHVRSLAHGFYNGVADEDHGVDHWARRGLVGRAVLADVERWRRSVGRPLRPDTKDPISVADLVATLEAQGTTVETGDILLVRTGWLAHYRSLDRAGREALATSDVASPGLAAGTETAAYLWNLHIAAVAADNPALEAWPAAYFTVGSDERRAARGDHEALVGLFLHFSLLPLLGLPVGELFDLDALAEDSAADGRYTSLLTSAPLNLAHGVASPPNALALK